MLCSGSNNQNIQHMHMPIGQIQMDSYACTVAHKGPYFNGLKRKWEAQSASSFVGGSTALSLFYRRINDTCAVKRVGLKQPNYP